MVRVAVVGARGYLGRELVRLLLRHPDVDAVVPVSLSGAGGAFGESVPAFRHRSDLTLAGFEDPAARDADVVFLATAGGEARTLMPELDARGARCVVDLSRDHRHEALAGEGGWVYGLAEAGPGVPRGARRIANPGCYPTATLLGIAPALAGGLLGDGPIIADGKSGVSGAGATPRADLHYAETNESVRAYKVLGHDHGAEIRLAAHRIEHAAPRARGTAVRPVRFTPHLVPQNRGLLATVYAPLRPGVEAATLRDAYAKAYTGAAFVRLVPEPDTSHVRGSNFADVAADVDPEVGWLVARSAIDNLIKGGSGAAVQNMNIALGRPETAGLDGIGGGP